MIDAIPERACAKLESFVGPEDYVAYVQSWWSGNSCDLLALTRSGSVLCLGEGEVMIGGAEVIHNKTRSIDKKKASMIVSEFFGILSKLENQEIPTVLSHFSSFWIGRVGGVSRSVFIAGGISREPEAERLENLFHDSLPDLMKFYRRGSR